MSLVCSNRFSVTHWRWCVALVVIAALGCEPPPKAAPVVTPPPVAGSPIPGTVAPAATPAVPAPGAATGIPPELIAKVQELVKVTKEYSAVAEKITTGDEYRARFDELSAIDGRLAPLVEDLMIAESKLTPAQNAEFQSKQFEAFAKPVVEEKRRHMQRLQALLLQ